MRTVKYTELQTISTAWDKLEQNARFVMRFLYSTQLLSPSFHSVEMLMDSLPQLPYYLKYSLQQMAELYPQFIKLIVSGIFKLLFHVVI